MTSSYLPLTLPPIEIAASSASIDMHQKLNIYRRNQVQEYLVWRVYDRDLD